MMTVLFVCLFVVYKIGSSPNYSIAFRILWAELLATGQLEDKRIPPRDDGAPLTVLTEAHSSHIRTSLDTQ